MPGFNKRDYIIEQLKQQIDDGIYPPGSQLPPEPELAQRYNISRGTVRLAMSQLQQQGLVARRPGAGTFVLNPMKKDTIASFFAQMKARRKTPTTVVRSVEKLPASDVSGDIWRPFLFSEENLEGESFYKIERLRLGDGEPFALHTVYILASDFAPDLHKTADFSKSLFALYAQYHRFPAAAEESICARIATEDEAKLFQMTDWPVEKRVLYVRERLTQDQEGMALEYLIAHDRGDFYQSYSYRLTKPQ